MAYPDPTPATEDTVGPAFATASNRSLALPSSLLNALPMPVFYLDHAACFRYLNPAASELMGIEAETLLGKTWEALPLPEALIETLREYSANALSTGKAATCMVSLPTSGGLRSYEIVWTPFSEPDSEQGGVLATFQAIPPPPSGDPDPQARITELNRTLQRRIHEFETMFEVMPIALFLADDPECRTIRGNPAASRILATPEGANISKSAPEGEAPTSFKVFRHGRELRPDELPMQVAAATGKAIVDYEEEVIWNDGTVVNLFGYASPLFDEQGAVRGCLGAFVDITLLRKAELKIADLNARLHRSIYESHHRIKNHLQMLSAMVDMMVMSGEERIPVQEMRRLGTQIQALAIVHDILTQETKVDGESTGIPAKRMLERLLVILEQSATTHRIDYAIPDTVLSSRVGTSLALIVNELVSNAIKHGRSAVEITFTIEEGQGWLHVRDDGPGFPADFDPRRAAQTGLDLIANLTRIDLNGEVFYRNRPEGGGHVTVRFPLE